MIPCTPKHLNHLNHYLKTFGSQIETANEGSLKIEKATYAHHDFWLNTLRDNKVRAAKDHGKSSEVGSTTLLAESSIEFHYRVCNTGAKGNSPLTTSYRRRIFACLYRFFRARGGSEWFYGKSKCEGRNCLDLEHYKLVLHRELWHYYFKFPSNFQEILIDQEHLLLNLCTWRSKLRFDMAHETRGAFMAEMVKSNMLKKKRQAWWKICKSCGG